MPIGKKLLALFAGGSAVGVGAAAAGINAPDATAVSDTGPGIPEAEMTYVLDRLYRGHSARTGAPAGAGLGLAIVASLTRPWAVTSPCPRLPGTAPSSPCG